MKVYIIQYFSHQGVYIDLGEETTKGVSTSKSPTHIEKYK